MKSSILVVALLLCGMDPIFAQPLGVPREGRSMERVEQLKKVRLVEMLNLSEEQSIRFFARLNEHENLVRDLRKDKMDLLDKIERLVRNDSDGKEYEKLFPGILAIDGRIVEEQQKFFVSLSDLISVEQRGKFLLFERQFHRELREAMRESRRRSRMRDE